jgi:hypothetical protein
MKEEFKHLEYLLGLFKLYYFTILQDSSFISLFIYTINFFFREYE